MKIHYLLPLLIMSILTACSHSTPMRPASTEMDGDMGQYLNVVDTESEYTTHSSDSASMKITLHCNHMMPVDINFKLTITFLDADSSVIGSAGNILSPETRTTIANMSEGETSTVTLENLPVISIPENGEVKFVISSSITTHNILSCGNYTLHGEIGQDRDTQPVTMTLSIDSLGIKGLYYYDRKGKASASILYGQYITHDETLNLNDTISPQEVNSFRGKLEADTLYTGTYIDNTTGLASPFRLVMSRDRNIAHVSSTPEKAKKTDTLKK